MVSKVPLFLLIMFYYCMFLILLLTLANHNSLLYLGTYIATIIIIDNI